MVSVSAEPGCVVSFGAAKAALEAFGLSPESHPAGLSQSMRILYPLDEALARSVRAGATSLTDSATTAEQIRFFQHQRARRSFTKLARAVTERCGQVSVHVADCHRLDEASRRFFHVAATTCGWDVTMAFGASDAAVPAQPRPREQALLDALSGVPAGDQVEALCAAAFDYVNAGDAWTAVNIGRVLQDVEQSNRVWNLLALGHAMLDETVQAERYYDLWADSGTSLDTVRALYGKSMLYARHHPAGLRSLDESERILGDAYAIIKTLGVEARAEDEVVFDEVFNRNGFALTLFRRKRVQEAMDLLRWGIDTLGDTSEKIAIHRTVLMYNLAQCLKQIGDLPGAIGAYRDLLAVDPHMPEYHLEYAKCLAATGDHAAAGSACLAAIELDDTLAAGWSLLGVYRGELGDFSAAADAHERAALLDPDADADRTDAAYNLVRADRHADAEALLSASDRDGLPRAEVERRASLLAEIRLAQDRPEAARDIIDAAILRDPGSEVLAQNRAAIADMLTCT